jgi:acetyl esterase/lipase
MKLLLLLFFLSPFILLAQVKRDTSFTIHSAYTKEKKHYPQIAIPQVVQPVGVHTSKDITYSMIGNRMLKLDVYYPAKRIRRGYPAILLVFGGGWKSGSKEMWEAYGYKLAEQGFVAVAAEYRLSPEALYPAAVHDLKAAIRWMREHANIYNIDSKRIAAMGASAGGQLASLLGTTNGNVTLEGAGGHSLYGSDVQAVVNIDGVLAFKHPESAEGKVAGEWFGGTYEEKPQAWQDASALNHVDKNAAPVSFINSSNPRFHAGRDDMIRKLDSLGIYSEVHEFEKTPHTFWLFHPWYDDVINKAVTFLRKIF